LSGEFSGSRSNFYDRFLRYLQFTGYKMNCFVRIVCSSNFVSISLAIKSSKSNRVDAHWYLIDFEKLWARMLSMSFISILPEDKKLEYKLNLEQLLKEELEQFRDNVPKEKQIVDIPYNTDLVICDRIN